MTYLFFATYRDYFPYILLADEDVCIYNLFYACKKGSAKAFYEVLRYYGLGPFANDEDTMTHSIDIDTIKKWTSLSKNRLICDGFPLIIDNNLKFSEQKKPLKKAKRKGLRDIKELLSDFFAIGDDVMVQKDDPSIETIESLCPEGYLFYEYLQMNLLDKCQKVYKSTTIDPDLANISAIISGKRATFKYLDTLGIKIDTRLIMTRLGDHDYTDSSGELYQVIDDFIDVNNNLGLVTNQLKDAISNDLGIEHIFKVIDIVTKRRPLPKEVIQSMIVDYSPRYMKCIENFVDEFVGEDPVNPLIQSLFDLSIIGCKHECISLFLCKFTHLDIRLNDPFPYINVANDLATMITKCIIPERYISIFWLQAKKIIDMVNGMDKLSRHNCQFIDYSPLIQIGLYSRAICDSMYIDTNSLRFLDERHIGYDLPDRLKRITNNNISFRQRLRQCPDITFVFQ